MKKHIGEAISVNKFRNAGNCLLIYTGDNDSVDALTKNSLENGISANEILDDGLLNGMAIVGVKV